MSECKVCLFWSFLHSLASRLSSSSSLPSSSLPFSPLCCPLFGDLPPLYCSCVTSYRCSETPVRMVAAGGCSRTEVVGSGSSSCGQSQAVADKPGGPCLELGRRRSSRSPRSPAYWSVAETLRNQRRGSNECTLVEWEAFTFMTFKK